jgi:hypothetical protein
MIARVLEKKKKKTDDFNLSIGRRYLEMATCSLRRKNRVCFCNALKMINEYSFCWPLNKDPPDMYGVAACYLCSPSLL